MIKRLIPRKEIERAYKREVDNYEEQFKDEGEKKLNCLPDEMFQILGKVISFIENNDKIKGDKNENKQ